MTIYIFDDGTIESKLLKHELEKNGSKTKVIDTTYQPHNIKKLLEQIPKPKGKEDILLCHLHFCQEDFGKYKIDEQRHKLREEFPHLAIFFAYELMQTDDARKRAEAAGLLKQENFVKSETQAVTYTFDARVAPPAPDVDIDKPKVTKTNQSKLFRKNQEKAMTK